jgi:hypothetical protein
MHPKQAGLILVLLWLTGCATTAPTPPIETQELIPEQTPIEAQAQEHVHMQEQLQEQVQAQEHALTAERMLIALERIANVEAEGTKLTVEQLRDGVHDLTAGERFELLLLLTQKGADNQSLRNASQLLKGLEAEASEPSVKQVLRLQRHNLRLEHLYRKERRKSAELQKKIEYLKGLERELDDSNQRVNESLTPKPEQIR